jgi:hypothetical protein
MAILSKLVEERSQDVVRFLNALRIPSNFSRHEISESEDKDLIVQLYEWKANALDALKDLRRLLENKPDGVENSDLIYTCAAFQGDGEWTSEDMGALSSGKRSM